MCSAKPFVYRLECFHDKESDNCVPRIVYEALEFELEQSGIHRDQVNEEIVKAILKSLKLTQYLIHATKICCSLTGRAASYYFSPGEEDALVEKMIAETQNVAPGGIYCMRVVLELQEEKMKHNAKL